ncbi:T-complex protein 1 subunit alpha [Puccinia sorghi]|uniref:T-complex protein 1 subunit alpha n=1 Tax=Puccinia sorghi TaxID=27349 RepID=A0A0L6UXB6_9BASI|nr:T-complex protein 1 subunit alpha [Puccinia sorghi]
MLGGGQRAMRAKFCQENITAFTSIADILKSSLGPVGLDKSKKRN